PPVQGRRDPAPDPPRSVLLRYPLGPGEQPWQRDACHPSRLRSMTGLSGTTWRLRLSVLCARSMPATFAPRRRRTTPDQALGSGSAARAPSVTRRRAGPSDRHPTPGGRGSMVESSIACARGFLCSTHLESTLASLPPNTLVQP